MKVVRRMEVDDDETFYLFFLFLRFRSPWPGSNRENRLEIFFCRTIYIPPYFYFDDNNRNCRNFSKARPR